MKFTEEDVLMMLHNSLESLDESESEENETEPQIQGIIDFGNAGLLSNNTGLVLRMKDGTEFQITVVQSK
jgi:hypothetical protein